MSGGGGGGQQTTVQSTTPWAGQQPYLSDVMRNAQLQFNGAGPLYFQGNTVAQPTADTTNAQNMLRTYATGAGADTVNNALKASNFFTSGQVLDPTTNPYLASTARAAMQPVVDQYTQQVLPSLRSGAVAAGQFGGTRQGVAEGIAANGLTRAMANASAGIYSGGYQQGLNAMTQGLALAPSTINAGQLPAQALNSIGQQLQTQDQTNINAAIDKWNWQQNLPAQKLGAYANLVSGNYGGTSTTTQPTVRANPLGAALGGASVGASFGGPWGAAAGAGLGLLTSFL